MAGGTEQQLVELVSRLDRQRLEPQVVCLYGARAGRSLHFLAALQSRKIPVTVLDLGWSGFDKFRGVVQLARLIRKIRPDIVHSLNYHSNGLARLARLLTPPHVPIITSVYVEYTRKQLIYERLFGRLDTLTVCNSPCLQAQLSDTLPNRPIKLVYNGIDLERFSPIRRLSTGLSVVMIGRITQQKAAHILVEAVGILKQRGELPSGFHVTIVGERIEDHAQQLIDEAVRRYQLGDVISQLPTTDLPEDYFRAAAVSVLASLWEGLPNVMLESLACGCPVIISAAANCAGVVQDEVSGWEVPINDAEAVATAIVNVMQLSPEARQRMSNACREAVSDFTVAAMVREYEQIYELLSSCS